MKKQKLGLIGLGVMGRNLLLNIAEKGFPVAGYDIDKEKVVALENINPDYDLVAVNDPQKFLDSLETPRKILILVPAEIVDQVIDDLLPNLEDGDILIDGGNSHPMDTSRRMKKVAAKGKFLIGMGISGGSEGARHGPSMMPGGEKKAFEQVNDILTAAAAKVKEEACISYLGEDSAGHFVKMVHNGIEYGIMQLLAESYDIMKKGFGMTNREIHKVYSDWNRGKLNSFLVEITAEIFAKEDEEHGGFLIDHILDSAGQKGTGKWSSQLAMDLGVPVPTIDIAVAMRHLSAMKPERMKAEEVLDGGDKTIDSERNIFLRNLENSLYFSMLITYSQGFELLRVASEHYGYSLNLATIARIWRGGCIIRSAMLDDIMRAYENQDELPNMLFDPRLSLQAGMNNEELRHVICKAVSSSIAVPGFSSVIAYYDAFRSGRMPANLIQAQRDFFGGHKYKRIGEDGIYHTDW